jgi:iron complex transport system substrate-binding protein
MTFASASPRTRVSSGHWPRLLAALAAAVSLAACGSSSSASDGDGGAAAWTYTDDVGERIELDRAPERIVTYVGTGAALWDYGIRPVGVVGPLRQEDGSAAPAAGTIDVDTVEAVGDEEVDLEDLAALDPDLIVLQSGPSGLDPWPVTDEQLDEVREIAPVVAARGYGKPVSDVIAGYERLAEALGADLDAPELVEARADLAAASAAFEAAAASKPGLVAMFVAPANDALYVAKTPDFPDLLEFERLGLSIVEAGGRDDYFQSLSWEQAGRHDADLILVDERSFSLQPDELGGFPTWDALPAVGAGQLGSWNAETVFSPQGFAAALERLTETLGTARTDIV